MAVRVEGDEGQAEDSFFQVLFDDNASLFPSVMESPDLGFRFNLEGKFAPVAGSAGNEVSGPGRPEAEDQAVVELETLVGREACCRATEKPFIERGASDRVFDVENNQVWSDHFWHPCLLLRLQIGKGGDKKWQYVFKMRTSRLLTLLQILRQSRYPVSGSYLAQELGISLRTLYRDIATLKAEGADITGEPGIGYVLQKGFFLPPLMFSEDEMLAFMLGMNWVSWFEDKPLAKASRDVIAKVEKVVPQAVLDAPAAIPYGVGASPGQPIHEEDLSDLRSVIRRERKLDLDYQKPGGKVSHRTVWPVAIGYFPESRVLVAWCEKSCAFRHFRTDRIVRFQVLDEPIGRRRSRLLEEWRQAGP